MPSNWRELKIGWKKEKETRDSVVRGVKDLGFLQRVYLIEGFRREHWDEKRVKYIGFIGVVRIFPPKKWR